MKKLLLGLGSLAAVIAPVAAVVACGADSTAPAKGANENGAAIVNKEITDFSQIKTVAQLNAKLAEALNADVMNAMDDFTQVPWSFKNANHEEVTLNNAKDWLQTLEVKTVGYVKPAKGLQGYYSVVPKEGYKAITSPVLAWGSIVNLNGTISAWSFDKEGLADLFGDVMHGGASLSASNLLAQDPAPVTAYVNTYDLLNAFLGKTLA